MNRFSARAMGACLFTLAAFAPGTQAADGLTLRQAVDAALGGNPELQTFAFQFQALEARSRQAFRQLGGIVATWPPGLALEDVLFRTFPAQTISEMIDWAVEELGLERVNQTLTKAAGGKPTTIDEIREGFRILGEYSPDARALLGAAARTRKQGWFKSISKMEAIARQFLGPRWDTSPVFKALIDHLWQAPG